MIHIIINKELYGMYNRNKKLKDRNLIRDFFNLPQGNFNMLSVIYKMGEIGYKFSEDYESLSFHNIPIIWNQQIGYINDREKIFFIFDMCVSAVNHYTKLTEDQIRAIINLNYKP